MSAAINAASLKTMTEQLDRNQAIAERLDKITGQRAETIRETIREVHFQPATTVCRDAPAMRALDGRLRYQPDARVVALPPPDRLLKQCDRPADRPDQGDDRDLAAWDAENWQRGHDSCSRPPSSSGLDILGQYAAVTPLDY